MHEASVNMPEARAWGKKWGFLGGRGGEAGGQQKMSCSYNVYLETQQDITRAVEAAVSVLKVKKNVIIEFQNA